VAVVLYHEIALRQKSCVFPSRPKNRERLSSGTVGDKSFVGGEAITLDPDGFSISTDKAAQFYWVYKRQQIPTNRTSILSPSDYPIYPKTFVEGFLDWEPELDEATAEESIRNLLNEAVAMKEWTIPPNAFVEFAPWSL
jgi:hypothetical protein